MLFHFSVWSASLASVYALLTFGLDVDTLLERLPESLSFLKGGVCTPDGWPHTYPNRIASDATCDVRCLRRARA